MHNAAKVGDPIESLPDSRWRFGMGLAGASLGAKGVYVCALLVSSPRTA
jgi:hypothetical protein